MHPLFQDLFPAPLFLKYFIWYLPKKKENQYIYLVFCSFSEFFLTLISKLIDLKADLFEQQPARGHDHRYAHTYISLSLSLFIDIYVYVHTHT